MSALIFWSILYFAVSLYLLIEIGNFVKVLNKQNLINIIKHIFYQFIMTGVFLLMVGAEPTFFQSLFLVLCFFGSLVYLILSSLKSGDILSFIFGILMILLMAISILFICLSIISFKEVEHMLIALAVYFVFIIFLISQIKIVTKYKEFYICTILLLVTLGTILLFSAYLYPEDLSYRSIHNTLYNWGRTSEYTKPDDVLYDIQNLLLLIYKAALPLAIGYIAKNLIKKNTKV